MCELVGTIHESFLPDGVPGHPFFLEAGYIQD